jgi:Lysozyme like domain
MAVLPVSEIYNRSRRAGWNPHDAYVFTAVILAESGGNTDAHNPGGTGDGPVQINLKAHKDVTLLQARNPDFAFPYAHNLWRTNGFQPWEAYTGPDGKGDDGPWKGYRDQVNKGLTPDQAKEIGQSILDNTGNAVIDAAGNLPVVSDIGAIANVLAGFLKALQAGIKWITEPHNWVRMAEIAVGAGLIWSGAAHMTQLPGPGSVAKIAPGV